MGRSFLSLDAPGAAVVLGTGWLLGVMVVVGSKALQSRLALSEGRPTGGRDTIDIVKDDGTVVGIKLDIDEVASVLNPSLNTVVSVGRGSGSVVVVVYVTLGRWALSVAVEGSDALTIGRVKDCIGGNSVCRPGTTEKLAESLEKFDCRLEMLEKLERKVGTAESCCAGLVTASNVGDVVLRY